MEEAPQEKAKKALDRAKNYIESNPERVLGFALGFLSASVTSALIGRRAYNGMKIENVDHLIHDNGREQILIFLQNGAIRSFSKYPKFDEPV